MDLPLDLSSGFLVSGREELYQDLRLVLKNELWSFFSDCKLGSNVSVHTDDSFTLSDQIKSTVQAINGVSVSNLVVDDDYNVVMTVRYGGLITDFKFSLNEL